MKDINRISRPQEINALFVQDDVASALETVDELQYMGEYLTADYVESPTEALEVIEQDNTSAVISEYRFEDEDMDGLDLLEEVRSRQSEIPFIMYTGSGSEDVAVEAMRKGADEYVRRGEKNEYELMLERIKSEVQNSVISDELAIFKQVVEEAEHSVKITDSNGEIIYVNKEFEDRTGYRRAEVEGRDISEVIEGEYIEGESCSNLKESVLEGEATEAEILVADREGDEYWNDEVIFPVHQRGDVQYVVSIGREITDKKVIENRREVLNTLLRHDVSNQIQAASGFLEMLDTSEMNQSQRHAVETIENSVRKSSELIHGVRDILKNDPREAGNEEIDIDEVLEGTVEDEQSRAEARDKKIKYEPDTSAKIQAGPLVDEVICGAIENSIVHADEAEVIELDFEETRDGVEVVVADDGEGLPEEFSFDKGVKDSNSDGTGVGTWLMREVANAYGGEVEAGESEYGGAEFRFTFEKA